MAIDNLIHNNITLQYPVLTHHLSSGQPEGLAIIIIIFIFPALFVIKGKLDFNKITHEFMADTEKLVDNLMVNLFCMYEQLRHKINILRGVA